MGKNIDIWLAFVAAIFGGAGLKIIESILSSRQRSQDVASRLLQESNVQLNAVKEQFHVKENELQARIDAKEREADEWQAKYWDLREKGVQKD